MVRVNGRISLGRRTGIPYKIPAFMDGAKKKETAVPILIFTLVFVTIGRQIRLVDGERREAMEKEDLEDVYERYYTEVYLYALSLCRNRTDAEDLTGESFLKALICLEKSGGSIKFWLMKVCRNLWLDRLRKERRLTSLLDEEIERLPDGQDLLGELVENERNRQLYDAVLRLPPGYREPVILFYYGGLPTRDVAKVLGITDTAVRTRLYRARMYLGKQLEQEDL